MHSFAWWPTVIVLAVATFTDLRNRRIPNWLVLPFLVVGIGASTWQHGWHGLGQSFAGLALGLLLYGFLFWMGGMGAGDVKLAAAIGAWIGPSQLFIALVVTAMKEYRFFYGSAVPKTPTCRSICATRSAGIRKPMQRSAWLCFTTGFSSGRTGCRSDVARDETRRAGPACAG